MLCIKWEKIYLRKTNETILIDDLYHNDKIWDLDTEDWKNKDKDRIADYIVSNAHDGSIVLLHDLYETSVDGALLAMERLEKEGYAFVTIDEMIKIKDIQLDINKNYYIYDSDNNKFARDSVEGDKFSYSFENIDLIQQF